MTVNPSSQQVITAYRHFLKLSFRAIRYSQPARTTLRARIRRAFRESPIEDFDTKRIANTLRFLENAGRDTGLEHRVLKSLLSVWGGEDWSWRMRPRQSVKGAHRRLVHGEAILTRAYDPFYDCIRGLNQTMGMCIR